MQKDLDRIRRMERMYDTLRIAAARGESPGAMEQEIRALAEYMDSGQWLRDYESDEQGLWPDDLKRGVLSQDGLYHLLTEIEETRKMRTE